MEILFDPKTGASSLILTALEIVLGIAQIVLLDIVFSLGSVNTAVGMARHVPVMAAACEGRTPDRPMRRRGETDGASGYKINIYRFNI